MCGEGRDLCYSGPFNAVISFIYYFSFKKEIKGSDLKGGGVGGGECQQQNTDCNVRKVYFCILINIVQFLIQCSQRVNLSKILDL